MRLIDMQVDELLDQLEKRQQTRMDPLRERIESLEEAFALQAPSFDATHAAMYCGKSVQWINNLVRNYNLPRTKTANNSTRYLKEHLDHFLQGGEFTPSGEMVPLDSETQIKRVG